MISNSHRWFVIADYRKVSDLLGKKVFILFSINAEKWKYGVPIEVVPMAYKAVASKLKVNFSNYNLPFLNRNLEEIQSFGWLLIKLALL